MAARRPKQESVSKGTDASKSKDTKADMKSATQAKAERAQLAADHLPPLALVFTVLACSGALWILAMRDVLATGRIIAWSFDESMQLFTKSTDFFDDSRGWKSTQGGLSSIQSITTDANNMGGLFVRKMGGAAVAAVQTQKLLPLLFHPVGAQWNMGHFQPLLLMAIVSNLAISAFYALYLEHLAAAEADGYAKMVISVLVIEAFVMLGFSLNVSFSKPTKQPSAVSMPEGKTPCSATSNIVRNTVVAVSTCIALIAGRDLFFPGHILDFIPRDDIYLEWTGALVHSPPDGSEEAAEHSLESPLYIGDKFLSQLMALHLLILCAYKLMTALVIRYGSDGSGIVKCKMIWKAQALGNGMLLFLCRLFAPAAGTASLDLRWHLMALGYETFILGLYGFT